MANGYKPVAKNFVNFDDYLAQNDPSKLVQSATGDLGKKAGQLQSDIGQAQAGFTQKALAGTGGAVGQTTTPGAPYKFFANNPQNDADAQRLANQGYTGPRSLAEAMGRDVTNEVGDVASRVKGLGSAEGRMTALQEQQKGTGYTRGMSTYDSALLGGSQQGQRAIGELQQKYGGLAGFLGEAQKQTGATAAEVEGLTQGVQGAAREYLARPKPPPTPPPVAPPTPEELQAATDARNTQLNVNYTANQTPGDERIRNVGDEQAAARYGDKVLNEWIAAGRPEFSGWIRTKKKRK